MGFIEGQCNPERNNKMKFLLKCLDEEKFVKRCIGDFHDLPWVDDIIVIDGGSTDYTVLELNQFSKVRTYIHPWLDWFHNMECSQSNIGLSYIPNGEWFFILDFDERMSDDLKQFLSNFKPETTDCDLLSVARRTFEPMRYPDTPHAVIDDDGWPIKSHQIGQFPDFQPRLIKKSFHMHWINSPHHQLDGHLKQGFLLEQLNIIHYEKDDYRDRIRIEKKWLRNKLRRQELGLTADVFECNTKPEVQIFDNPEYWRNK
ncbi:MAG: glycosyltransferase [Patescibacteria group bacterium]